MLQQGEPVTYVQPQLGHASIQLTVDTYGKWLQMGNKAAVDRLDAVASDETGSKMVASAGIKGEDASNSLNVWSRRLESNQRPAVYETAALPTELRRRWMTANTRRVRNDDMIARRLQVCQSSFVHLFKPRERQTSGLGSGIDWWNTEGVLRLPVFLFGCHGHVLLHIRAQLSCDDDSVLIAIGGSTQPF
jgi:hypothetical protein